MQETNKERFFSVELKSKVSLKNVTMTNGGLENVLVEGTIGELQRAEFAEGVILEVVGDKGVLRINLAQEDIKKAIVEGVTKNE
ncbi:MAG: hypothetical protein ABSF65_10495 [Candidatus Bathyarchaeia archaeon]|jgi:hypothetical protein